jgi:diguanylate cyclase
MQAPEAGQASCAGEADSAGQAVGTGQTVGAGQADSVGRANNQGLHSQAVIASMRQHGIRFTADNYGVWQSYMSGTNPVLKRAIDIVLSNGGTIDQGALQRLYTRHFCPARSALAVREQAQQALDKLNHATTILCASPCPAGLLALLEDVSGRMHAIMSGTQAVLARLSESEERVALLESHLNDATRDASTDGLTGLLNRRAFDLALRSAAAEAMNSGDDLAFILIDVDHFKHVNDDWGHAVGDEVLRHVAALLMRTVRGGDLVARYGGEEFAIILNGTGRRGALSVAENLREAVSTHPFVVPHEVDGVQNEARLHVTISAGIACYTAGEAIGGWLGRADAALYRAKHAGRNRVVFGATPALPRPPLHHAASGHALPMTGGGAFPALPPVG